MADITRGSTLAPYVAFMLEADPEPTTKDSLHSLHAPRVTCLLDEFGRRKGEHPLCHWLRYFDKDGNGTISYREFERGMRSMDYSEDLKDLFQQIDLDGSGVLDITEFDNFSTDLWSAFKRWCAANFASAEEMVVRLSRGNKDLKCNIADGRNRNRDREVVQLYARQFRVNAVKLGWFGNYEPLIFFCLDLDLNGFVVASKITWFEDERRQHQRRVKLKNKLGRALTGRANSNTMRSLQSFTSFLRSRYGCLFRAWRDALDLDASMFVERRELFRACGELGWNGDHTALWHALDSDDSGTASLEELAAREARLLAQFKQWAESNFGNMTFCFRHIMRHARQLKEDGAENDTSVRSSKDKLSFEGWERAMDHLEFPFDSAELFHLLDWEDDGYITHTEVHFLNLWRPVEWLAGAPNAAAAEEVRALLLQTYGHMAKAWRMAFDRDCTGRANWAEFQLGIKRINFQGDAIGAWLSLDAYQVGFLTLHELDAETADSLAIFRRWAYAEFGGIMLAFKQLDDDDSGTLSLREFKNLVKLYQFKADPIKLFNALNVDNDGTISKSEIAFLDDWELDIMPYRGDQRYLSRKDHQKKRTGIAMHGAQTDLLRGTAQSIQDFSKSKKQDTRQQVLRPRRGLPPFWIALPGNVSICETPASESSSLGSGEIQPGSVQKQPPSGVEASHHVQHVGSHLLELVGWNFETTQCAAEQAPVSVCTARASSRRVINKVSDFQSPLQQDLPLWNDVQPLPFAVAPACADLLVATRTSQTPRTKSPYLALRSLKDKAQQHIVGGQRSPSAAKRFAANNAARYTPWRSRYRRAHTFDAV